MERKLAARLIKQHGTNEPVKLIKAMGIILLIEDLGNSTWGYYTNICRIPCIHINTALSAVEKRYAAAHELGHHLLHPGVSTPFLRANTLQSIDKIEREANEFAVELLILNDLLLEGMTIYEAARQCGVPEEVAHLKKPPKQSIWRNDPI